MARKIIAFTGYARVGKDTAGGFTGFRRMAFADALKQEMLAFLKNMYQIDVFRCTPEQKELIRWALVGHGATMRNLHPGYWIEHLETAMPENENIAITDLRYPDEADWVHAHGGKVVWIIRPGYEAANEEERLSIQAIRHHHMVDEVIDNCGSLDDLRDRVVALLARAAKEE